MMKIMMNGAEETIMHMKIMGKAAVMKIIIEIIEEPQALFLIFERVALFLFGRKNIIIRAAMSNLMIGAEKTINIKDNVEDLQAPGSMLGEIIITSHLMNGDGGHTVPAGIENPQVPVFRLVAPCVGKRN